MPKKARVFIVEDFPATLYVGCRELKEAGHQVVVQAETLQEALAQVPQLGELGVNVAVLDGNLNHNNGTGSDGAAIARLIRKLHPSIKIIQWSMWAQSYGWSDEQVQKADVGSSASQLASKVTSL